VNVHAEQLVSESGPLVQITGEEVAPGRFRFLELQFVAGTLRLGCDD
jgi:hypothetical protein